MSDSEASLAGLSGPLHLCGLPSFSKYSEMTDFGLLWLAMKINVYSILCNGGLLD